MQKRILPILLISLLSINWALAKEEEKATLSPEKLAQFNEIVQRGDTFLIRKNYQDAITEFYRALAIKFNDYMIYNKIGLTYQLAQNFKQAKKAYEKAKKIDPNRIEAINNLGTVFYLQGKYGKAVRNYKKVIEINPNLATVYQNMGTAYFSMKKYDLGFKAFKEAYRLDPHIMERTPSLGTISKTINTNQGIQNYYLAKIYASNGELEKALSFLEKAIENGFNDFEKIRKDPDFEKLRQNERFINLSKINTVQN